MDRTYQFLKSHTTLISNILLGCAAFSSIITLERADYNLFLFLFVAYSMFWKSEDIKPNQRIISIERMLFRPHKSILACRLESSFLSFLEISIAVATERLTSLTLFIFSKISELNHSFSAAINV